MKTQCLESSPPSHNEIADQLERMLSSPDFKATPQQTALLKYVVDQSLAGNADRIKGYTVATEVFGRGPDFDQGIDPIVSIQAARLRQALKRFYATAGRRDSIRIDIPKGGYVPSFATRPQVQTTETPIDAASPAISAQRFWPSVLVQPLHNISGDPELDFWGHGLASEIALELDRYPDIRVMTRSPGNPNKTADPRSVQFKIDGSVLSDETSVKLTVRLTDTHTGRQIWCDSHRSAIEAARRIAFQEEIARGVAVKIAGEHGWISKTAAWALKRHPPQQIEVYDAVLRYYEYDLSYAPEAFSRALAGLEKAVTLDPQCGQAWALLARLFACVYAFEIPGFCHPLEKAHTFAQNGTRLLPGDQRAHAVMAFVHLLGDDLQAGRAEAERALALDPKTLFMRDRIGYLMTLLGDWERGPALIEEIIALNPLYNNHVHYALWVNGLRQDDYESAYRETLKLNQPALFWVHLARASTLGLLGNIEDGRRAAAELLKLKPDFHARGRILIRHLIKFEDIAERVIEGLDAVGITVGKP